MHRNVIYPSRHVATTLDPCKLLSLLLTCMTWTSIHLVNDFCSCNVSHLHHTRYAKNRDCFCCRHDWLTTSNPATLYLRRCMYHLCFFLYWSLLLFIITIYYRYHHHHLLLLFFPFFAHIRTNFSSFTPHHSSFSQYVKQSTIPRLLHRLLLTHVIRHQVLCHSCFSQKHIHPRKSSLTVLSFSLSRSAHFIRPTHLKAPKRITFPPNETSRLQNPLAQTPSPPALQIQPTLSKVASWSPLCDTADGWSYLTYTHHLFSLSLFLSYFQKKKKTRRYCACDWTSRTSSATLPGFFIAVAQAAAKTGSKNEETILLNKKEIKRITNNNNNINNNNKYYEKKKKKEVTFTTWAESAVQNSRCDEEARHAVFDVRHNLVEAPKVICSYLATWYCACLYQKGKGCNKKKNRLFKCN